jgi:hypothetical protein
VIAAAAQQRKTHMSNTTWSGRGSYTDFFTSVPAGDVAVRGLPPGSAGSTGFYSAALSSTPALFAISPDLAHMFAVAATRKLVPARPGAHSNAPATALFAIAA